MFVIILDKKLFNTILVILDYFFFLRKYSYIIKTNIKKKIHYTLLKIQYKIINL